MESHTITALFARFYGERMTWDGHLQLVDHLESWTVDHLLAFQEALLDHLAAGRWVGTVPNLRVDLPGGGSRGADNPLHRDANDLTVFLEGVRVGADEAELAMLDEFAASERVALTWQPDPRLRHEVPHDCIGIPIDSWIYEGPRERVPEEEQARTRRSLKREATQDSFANAEQLRWILRAAPWAYFRKTGRRLAGYPPLAFEERERSGEALNWFSIAHRLSNPVGDTAIVISVFASYTEDLARHDAQERLKGVARRVGARRLSRPVDVQRGAVAQTQTWSLPDGQLVWEGPAMGDTVLREGIVHDLDSVVGGVDRSVGYETPLPDDDFWKHISSMPNGLQDGDVSPLIDSLVQLGGKRVLEFSEALARKLVELDRPELFAASQPFSAIPMSADVFLYSRCAVVARGREAFERVLAVGQIDVSEWPVEFGELLLTAAPRAYTAKTGEDYDYEPSVSFETGGGRPRRIASDRVATSVRSRRLQGKEARDTIIQWRTADSAEARARHLTEVTRLYDEESRLIDEVRLDFDRVATTVAISGVAYYCGVDL